MKNTSTEKDLLIENGGLAEQGGPVNFPEIYERSELYTHAKQDISELTSHFKENPIQNIGDTREYATSFVRQTLVVCKRTVIQIARNPMVTYAQLGQTIFLALLVGSIYWQIDDTQGSIQDRVGALFFIMTNQAFGMMSSLNICKYPCNIC